MENQTLLTTKEVALTLDVSESTVRRWANSGYLPCYRVGKSKYRKFQLKDIEKIRQEIYSPNNINSGVIKHQNVIKNDIPPLPHPAHYLMHRYWGRKAHNVVNEYIKFFTKDGDIILDPFMGSGISIIEALKLNRRAVGVDLNPMSTFIVNSTINAANLKEFEEIFYGLFEDLHNKYSYLYETHCPKCNSLSYIETNIWDVDKLIKVRGKCKEHGTFIKEPDAFDFAKIEEYKSLFDKLNLEGELSYPKDSIMQYVRRSGRERIDELFTERALIILSHLRKRILEVSDKNIRNLLLLCFTSMLPNVSRMLPGDEKKCTYKSGWVISKFWTPTIHTERDIFSCFTLRFKTILKGKKELVNLDSDLAKIYNSNSTDLFMLKDNSIDYCFTDPPYGESIAYFALSHFWNSWLNNYVDYDDEIIIDSYRNKQYEDYDVRIKRAFREIYRVLKPNHYLSFTFQNRDLNVWKSILEGCLEAGFELVNIVMQSQAVSSGTQGINKKNTLTGDFVYNFRKTLENTCNNQFEYLPNAEEFIIKTLREFIAKKGGVTSAELYEYIIPIIAKQHAYCDNSGKVINMEKLIKKHFDYIEIINFNSKGLGGNYKWIIK